MKINWKKHLPEVVAANREEVSAALNAVHLDGSLDPYLAVDGEGSILGVLCSTDFAVLAMQVASDHTFVMVGPPIGEEELSPRSFGWTGMGLGLFRPVLAAPDAPVSRAILAVIMSLDTLALAMNATLAEMEFFAPDQEVRDRYDKRREVLEKSAMARVAREEAERLLMPKSDTPRNPLCRNGFPGCYCATGQKQATARP